MSETSFEGLLTDYALGEIDDPDTKALLEALLARDESHRATLAEIRNTTELIVLVGAESLVGGSQPKRPARAHRPARFVVTVGIAAALVLASLIWWWPTSTNTQSDSSLANSQGGVPEPVLADTQMSDDADAARSGHPLPWLTAAVEQRSTRPSRRGAGIRWPLLVVGQTGDRR